MLLALKTYPFKIYINDSNGVSAFNPIAELNLTSGPTILTAEYSVYGNAPTSASARYVSVPFVSDIKWSHLSYIRYMDFVVVSLRCVWFIQAND